MSNKVKSFCLSLSFILLLSLGLSEAADAARFGGGKSFGSRPSYSMPYKRSTEGSTINSAPQRPANTPLPAPSSPMRNGLMGMLGGLAIGGLLGSLLSGGGFHGLNILDFLVFAGIAFLAYKLLSGRRSQPQPVTGDQTFARDEVPASAPYARQAGPAGFDTDILSHKGAGAGLGGSSYQPSQAAPAIPADFDLAGFLDGAKAAYRLLQEAWDHGDMADIRGLVTDRVFAEIQEQYRARQGSNHTELLKLAAELLEVRDRNNDREASVLFDALLRETEDERPKQVREVWHFIRSKTSRQPTWFLDGIQQLED